MGKDPLSAFLPRSRDPGFQEPRAGQAARGAWLGAGLKEHPSWSRPPATVGKRWQAQNPGLRP